MKFVAGLSVFVIGFIVLAYSGTLSGLATGNQILMGDVDCGGSVGAIDSLKILRYDAGLTYDHPASCPAIGTAILTGPTATPVPTNGFSRDNPVPSGTSYQVPEGWEIEITNFIPNATQLVLDENQFNDPPQAGYKFALVRVRIKNVAADDPDNPSATSVLSMVGSLNVGYTTLTNSCGVIPDRIDSSDVFRGGEIEGNICFEVGQNESNFVLYTTYSFDEEDYRWFAVN